MSKVDKLKEVITEGASIASVVVAANAAGWNIGSIIGFVTPLAKLPDLIKDGAEILEEIKTLDDAGRDELDAHIKVAVTLPNANTEGLVEDFLSILVAGIAIANKFRPAEVAPAT